LSLIKVNSKVTTTFSFISETKYSKLTETQKFVKENLGKNFK